MPRAVPSPLAVDRPVRVSCVCLGNICRSPMAAAILRARAAAAGLPMIVSSAGTAGWHPGRPAHPATVAELTARGIPSDHAARAFDAADFADLDLILAMDHRNLAHLDPLAPNGTARTKLHLIRDFDTSGPPGREVPDPYCAGPERYREVFEMLDAACRGLLARISAAGPPPWTGALPGRR